MIVVISEKDLAKKAKKLVKYNDYSFMDATGEEDNRLNEFANVYKIARLQVPSKCLVKASKLDGSADKVKDKFRKFIKSDNFVFGVGAIGQVILKQDGNVNIFIALKNKAYDRFAKAYAKQINKLLGFDAAVSFKDLDKSTLEDKVKKKDLKKISKFIKKMKKEK